jgi:hypothetical protein
MKQAPPSCEEDRPAMMTLQRLQELLDAYGANPEHWPANERPAAQALLERSDEARVLRNEAARLDALLDLAPRWTPSAELQERVLAFAPTVNAPTTSQGWRSLRLLRVGRQPHAPRAWRSSGQERTQQRRLWFALAAAASLVVAFWGARTPRPSQPGLSSEAIANLGVFDSPTDVLLQWPGVDNLSALPSVGCGESEFGCPQFDAVPEGQSQAPRTIGRRYV